MASVAEHIPAHEAAVHLRRESTAEQVAAALRELIVSARLAPGTHLREGPLASQLGVSRNTVREAVQILVSRGLVTREIHRGAYVARLTVDDVHDLFRVRRLVELNALRELAGSPRASALHDALRRLAGAIESGDRDTVADADLHFHRQLVDLIESERLGDLYAGVEAQLRLCIALAGPNGPQPSVLLEDHEAIVAALEAGDVDAAAQRLERHLDEGERQLVDALAAESAVASSGAN
jgi:DNA-binding GntR family transcriptional regulator